MEKISVNSYNLKQCLNSVINQHYNSNKINLEVIVVDSGSIDNSRRILNKYKNKIKIILNPYKFQKRLSPALARNLGAKTSKGNILIFSDADCIFPPDWVSNIYSIFKKNKQIDCILGGRSPDVGKGIGTFYRRYSFILYSRKFRISKPILINKNTIQLGMPLILIAANNFAIRKKTWKVIGGMNTCFSRPAGEDILMEIELIKKGYNILFVPDIIIIHNHPLSLIKLVRKVFYQGESVYLINKYSNGYLNWKHLLQLKIYFKNILASLLFIIILILVNIPLWLKILIFSIFFLILIINRLTYLKTRLRLIMEIRDKEYRKRYQLSFFQLFYFDLIDLMVKAIRFLGFISSCFKRIKIY